MESRLAGSGSCVVADVVFLLGETLRWAGDVGAETPLHLADDLLLNLVLPFPMYWWARRKKTGEERDH